MINIDAPCHVEQGHVGTMVTSHVCFTGYSKTKPYFSVCLEGSSSLKNGSWIVLGIWDVGPIRARFFFVDVSENGVLKKNTNWIHLIHWSEYVLNYFTSFSPSKSCHLVPVKLPEAFVLTLSRPWGGVPAANCNDATIATKSLDV